MTIGAIHFGLRCSRSSSVSSPRRPRILAGMGSVRAKNVLFIQKWRVRDPKRAGVGMAVAAMTRPTRKDPPSVTTSASLSFLNDLATGSSPASVSFSCLRRGLSAFRRPSKPFTSALDAAKRTEQLRKRVKAGVLLQGAAYALSVGGEGRVFGSEGGDEAAAAIAAVKWDHWDELGNIYPRGPDGYAWNTADNVGVQYGLGALRRGD